MASLGWVTPGAASESVTPLFFSLKTWRPFLLIAVTIAIAFYCFHLGVTHPSDATVLSRCFGSSRSVMRILSTFS